MARAFVADYLGVSRLAKRLFIGDAGSVTRQAKRIFIGDAGGVARLVYQSGYSGILHAGAGSFGGRSYTGYSVGSPAIGSLTPTTDPNGHTIEAITWSSTLGYGEIDIGIFGSDPLQSYWQTLIINGVSFPSSSADAYFFSGGVAQWQFNGLTNFVNGNNYTIEIDYP